MVFEEAAVEGATAAASFVEVCVLEFCAMAEPARDQVGPTRQEEAVTDAGGAVFLGDRVVEPVFQNCLYVVGKKVCRSR